MPGAVEADGPDAGVAAHYGSDLREQRTLAGGEGFVDLSHRDVVTIAGPDRLTWLHALTTQYLEGLKPGTSTTALLLSPTGHVEHAMYAVDDGTTFWLHTEPGAAAALIEWLRSMVFMSRVEVTDVTESYAVVWRPGPAPDGSHPLVRSGQDSLGGHEIFLPRAELGGWTGPVAGIWAYEALRIAAGSRGSASTPTTGRSRTSSAGSASPCTWRRAATAARRRSPGCTTSAARRAGWSGCTWTVRSTICPRPAASYSSVTGRSASSAPPPGTTSSARSGWRWSSARCRPDETCSRWSRPTSRR